MAAALLWALSAVAEPGDRLYVQVDTAAYAETSSLSAPVTSLEAGAEVVELERWASWVRVRFGPDEGDTGWVIVQQLDDQPPERDSPVGSSGEGGAPSPSAPPSFLLKVTADHTMRLRVNCDVVNEQGEVLDRNFDNTTPVNYRFREILAVSCEVRDREHVESKGLQAHLLQGDRTVAFAQTDAIYTRSVRLRSDGPWGRARGEVCRVRGVFEMRSSLGAHFAVECRER